MADWVIDLGWVDFNFECYLRHGRTYILRQPKFGVQADGSPCSVSIREMGKMFSRTICKKELFINMPALDSQRPEVDEHEAGGRDAGVGEDEVGELCVLHGPHLDPHAVMEQVVDILNG